MLLVSQAIDSATVPKMMRDPQSILGTERVFSIR
jgi:hypothetical protein